VVGAVNLVRGEVGAEMILDVRLSELNSFAELTTKPRRSSYGCSVERGEGHNGGGMRQRGGGFPRE
jgi:hypothetical protein